MAMMETTVRQFLDEGRMFTAYDVTIATRDREGIQMRHRDVRGACHEIQILSDACDFGWDDAAGGTVEWDRSRVDMPGGQWAFVYHPANVDPNNYAAKIKSTPVASPPSPVSTAPVSTAPVSTATAPVQPAQPTDSGGKNDDGSYGTDYRNRLFIPTSFLRAAGLSAGDECHVVCDKGNNVIMLAADGTNFQGSDVKVTTQRVERNGDLRLSSTTIQGADIDADKFVIENTQESQTAVVKVAAKG
jgi:hypothetical protein